ncbi:STAS domain-containing protein [Streptomyces laculatispora]|uniref:STAS domain-containing protein n=1 Tax=Streptomyces laculatispora TaxID=887464 RepID=A0ABY9I1M8_9ACTN|nr:STAS domain-containing protein [Streptomyces laculatispora]WLQ40519.1 STAS domain-containing protein [Streptomyces laculatispora]
MSEEVPVLQIGQVLLVSIQTDLDDRAVMTLQDDLAAAVVDSGAHGVVIDITAVEIVDSFVGRMLATVASISRMLDAQTVVVGMRPAVAITLVELGLSLGGVRTALTLDKGLGILEQARHVATGGTEFDPPVETGSRTAPEAATYL